MVDNWHNVKLAHSSVCKVCDNGDRIKEGTNSLDNIKCQNSEIGSVCVAQLPQSYWNEPQQKTTAVSPLCFY